MSELIYGFNVVTAAVESGYSLLNVRVTADNLDMIKLLKEKRIPFSLVSKEELNRLVPLCQGIMAEIAAWDSSWTDSIRGVGSAIRASPEPGSI